MKVTGEIGECNIGKVVEDRGLSGEGLRENRIREIEVRVKIIVLRNFVLKRSRWGIWDQEKVFILKMEE